MRTSIFALVLMMLGSGAACAESGLLYLGAGVTRETLEHSGIYINPEEGGSFDIRDATSWKAMVGVRPLRNLAVEADYLGPAGHTFTFGVTALPTHEEVRSVAGYGVGLLPLGRLPLDLFAKAGFNSWKLSASGYGGILNFNGGVLHDSGSDFAWGVGTQLHMARIGVRLEYEKLQIQRTDGLRILALSVTSSWF